MENFDGNHSKRLNMRLNCTVSTTIVPTVCSNVLSLSPTSLNVISHIAIAKYYDVIVLYRGGELSFIGFVDVD